MVVVLLISLAIFGPLFCFDFCKQKLIHTKDHNRIYLRDRCFGEQIVTLSERSYLDTKILGSISYHELLLRQELPRCSSLRVLELRV